MASATPHLTALGPYPEPTCVEPLRPPHRHTLILLHGRGDTACHFGPQLLAHPIPVPAPGGAASPTADATATLRQLLPHARFVFPSAAPRAVAVAPPGTAVPQWFDVWRLARPEEREDVQDAGLRETGAMIAAWVAEEARRVGRANVLVGGLSQGCAVTLATALGAGGSGALEGVAGAVGMCGWLPYRVRMEEAVEGQNWAASGSGHDGASGASGGGGSSGQGPAPAVRAMRWLQTELGVESGAGSGSDAEVATRRTPFWLAHGTADEKVPIQLGRGAAHFLCTLGADVEWIEYKHLSHWYSWRMLRDLVQFVKGTVGWDIGEMESGGPQAQAW